MDIGILALQGAFAEHAAVLARFPGVTARTIRQRADFSDRLAGLIIPGGESTVMAKLLVELELMDPITSAVRAGLPVFGTCAGLILLAREVQGLSAARIGELEVRVKRNAYGRQVDSFTTSTDFASMGAVPMVFIRAPAILDATERVVPLSVLNGQPVAVRQDNILATAFHPELTDDLRVHNYFLQMAAGRPLSAEMEYHP
ncbi:MAG: pyridoxal 5'-phosphate synthase glutaminase subunit PdxT [Planctomycetaceae bacterium]|nr:pyridoxal 5'-phosphate synthase glutaminase subunit PdxT [Planctomycetaceae bacterium]